MNASKINYPKTLIEAIRYFSDSTVTLNFFSKLRWPTGVCCPRCGSTNVLFMEKYSRWKCREKHAQPQFTVKVGTIMEDSPLALDKWAVAFWLEVNAKNSISSYELHRALGITQKSAWFMLHRIRHALHVGSFDKKLSGIVEADETFVGGLSKNMHASRRRKTITGPGTHGKTAVAGLLERSTDKGHSIVHAEVMQSTDRKALHALINRSVEEGSTIYSDAWKPYRELGEKYFHDYVDHAEAYVKDKVVHTNGLENFWCLFKRCIKGTHVSIEPFHLAAYVDSEAFRFNNRELDDAGRFLAAVKGMDGKRLTYKALTGALEIAPKSDSGEGSANPVN